MKNNKIINAWDESLPDDETKERMFDNIRQKYRTNKKQKSFKLRYVLTATFAVITISMLSAFGVIPFAHFGEVIKTLIFDGFEANKVDTLIYNDKNIDAMWDYEITDPKVKIEKLEGNIRDVYFETVEEAAEHLDFIPKTLGYLPEGCSFEYVRLLTYNNKYNKNSCELWYSDVILVTKYVGENATIKIHTTSDIEKIILNDGIEALLETIVTFPNGNSLYRLYWIKDSVGYMLGNNVEIDELIKMAESLK